MSHTHKEPKKPARHRFELTGQVREARKTSPLTEDDQKHLISMFNEWEDKEGEPPADIEELIAALRGESFTLGNNVYLNDSDFSTVNNLLDGTSRDSTLTIEDTGIDTTADADAIIGDEAGMEDESIATAKDDGLVNGNDVPLETPSEELVDDADDIISDMGHHVHDASKTIRDSIGGIFGHIRDSWNDYTADVREEPVASAGSDVDTGNNGKGSLPHDGDTDRVASMNGSKAPTGIPNAMSKVMRDNHYYGATVDGNDNGNGGTGGIAPLRKAGRVFGSARNIMGSFWEGVTGKPHTHTGSSDSEDAVTGHHCRYHTEVKVLVRVLAVVGALALVRAAMDAFRPRR